MKKDFLKNKFDQKRELEKKIIRQCEVKLSGRRNSSKKQQKVLIDK